MKNSFILFAALILFVPRCFADPVAVFDVQWGKGKERQSRSFAIAFFDTSAPQTNANLKKLGKDGFYVKTAFHRVFPNYLVQGGDPLSKKKDRTVIGTGIPPYTLTTHPQRKQLRATVTS